MNNQNDDGDAILGCMFALGLMAVCVGIWAALPWAQALVINGFALMLFVFLVAVGSGQKPRAT